MFQKVLTVPFVVIWGVKERRRQPQRQRHKTRISLVEKRKYDRAARAARILPNIFAFLCVTTRVLKFPKYRGFNSNESMQMHECN